jgi:hypothetical protein
MRSDANYGLASVASAPRMQADDFRTAPALVYELAPG